MMAIPRRRRRDAEGAAAVEFALVFPILMLVVFGILQYGLYFFDAHGTRSGVREAARLGVVQTDVAGSCNNANYMAELKCAAKDQVDAISGPIAVRVETTEWKKGTALVVCAEVQSQVVGLLPMPDDGLIRSKTQMSIEVDDTPPAALFSEDTALSGDWTWC
jgi:Flp pilus assembly protein TadG